MIPGLAEVEGAAPRLGAAMAVNTVAVKTPSFKLGHTVVIFLLMVFSFELAPCAFLSLLVLENREPRNLAP